MKITQRIESIKKDVLAEVVQKYLVQKQVEISFRDLVIKDLYAGFSDKNIINREYVEDFALSHNLSGEVILEWERSLHNRLLPFIKRYAAWLPRGDQKEFLLTFKKTEESASVFLGQNKKFVNYVNLLVPDLHGAK